MGYESGLKLSPSRPFSPRPALRRFLAPVALLSLALTILPTKWSVLRSSDALSGPGPHYNDPALEWKDDIYPFRPPTPWDISTSYSYPRELSFEVSRGTWLRLDVHPTSGDIVFDMLGDIYCLPGSSALNATPFGPMRARPIITGIPHDTDPHFSPSGDRLVWRSDAELGVENIWVVEWKGCREINVNPSSGGILGEEKGFVEQRLVKEGRYNAQRVTNETFRWITDPRFHPSGTKIIATKWYTSSRSLGAGEGWEYEVPSVEELRSRSSKDIKAGDGTRLVSRTLPPGWSPTQYGDQQIGPEQHIWRGNDAVIFAKNVVDGSSFTYSKDIHKGIYAIFQRNFTTGTTELLVEAFPGGASRPELSRDQRTLAFVRRVRDKEALVLKDLHTGTIHHVFYGLEFDLTGVSAPMGTYPSFAFTPLDDAIVIWAQGQIHYIPLSVNSRGERVASKNKEPKPIGFTAKIKKRIAETRKGGADVKKYETQDEQNVRAFQELRLSENGERVVVQAAGRSVWIDVGFVGDKPSTKSGEVPTLDPLAAYYSPSFVPGTHDLVIHARWSDSSFTHFELADINSGKAYKIIGLPLGRYFSPVLCECKGRKRTIAFLKSGGSYLSGDVLVTAGEGLYVGEVVLPDENGSMEEDGIVVSNLHFIPSEINTEDKVNMRFLESNKKLLVQQSDRAFIIDFDGPIDGTTGKPAHRTIAKGRMSDEIVVSPKVVSKSSFFFLFDFLDIFKHKGDKGGYEAEYIAFVDFFHVYFAQGKNVNTAKDESVWSRPANATKGLTRLSLDGGHDVVFSKDGERVFWFLGPYLHSLKISRLKECKKEIANDEWTFGIRCVKGLLNVQKVEGEGVWYKTDVKRLKEEATFQNSSDVIYIRNATLLTMHTSNLESDLIRNGTMVVRGGVIDYVGSSLSTHEIPEEALVVDAQGGYVVPGYIDVHAHWNGFADRYPAKSWEMETFLAYGVTTVHNPSAETVSGFSERARIERGQMVGPRVFTVGRIIYGAAEAGFHQDIVDMDQAKEALVRIKVEGGPASVSYKNYNLPSRAARQRLLKVAQDMGMLCVPEGGMNLDWDLTYIVDGMTTIEHAIPVPKLYDDILTLYALSGTGSVPTHIVNYGGAWGEQLVWANEDVPNDAKLRHFTRHDILEGLSESTTRPKHSFALYNTSESVATMVGMGLLASIGAHGEPPLGLNYHAEMGFAGQGGLSNYEVIRAATSSGAKTLGMFSSLGSLASGKLADFLVYPPGVDLLEGEINKKTRLLQLVARGGRIWEADTMVEVWPAKGRKQTTPVINAD